MPDLVLSLLRILFFLQVVCGLVRLQNMLQKDIMFLEEIGLLAQNRINNLCAMVDISEGTSLKCG